MSVVSNCPTCESSNIETRFSNVSVWQCGECRMLFRNPQPTDAELDRFYNAAFLPENVETNSTKMEGTTSELARQYVGFLAEKIGVQGKRVLEFGAGLGITCGVLRAAGADVTAIEPFAWRECEKAGVPTYRSLEELPEGLRFDLILSLEVVEHLRHPLPTLRDFRDRLTPGGWLYIATPNAASLRARLHGARWKELSKYGHMLFYTPATLELALKGAGFEMCSRVTNRVRYGNNPGRTLAHYALQAVGLEGELRYLAQIA